MAVVQKRRKYQGGRGSWLLIELGEGTWAWLSGFPLFAEFVLRQVGGGFLSWLSECEGFVVCFFVPPSLLLPSNRVVKNGPKWESDLICLESFILKPCTYV